MVIKKHFSILMALTCASIFYEINAANIEKPLVIVVTSFKNKDWYRLNLDSIFAQNYTNYRMIYLDDASPDGTGQLVENYIKERNLEHKVTLIRQKEWVSQMANHYFAVQMCEDHEIVVHIDGDDWLHGTEVFNIVNNLYSDNDIWLTYGSPLFSPSGDRWSSGMNKEKMLAIMSTNSFRDHGWPFTHLRTFYAWLFKQIKLKDLIFKGTFTTMSPAPDVAFMSVMLELAGLRSMPIDEAVYVYNEKNPISQFRIASQAVKDLEKVIHGWPKYKPLKKPALNYFKKFASKKADLIMLAEETNSLIEVLEAVQENLKNIGRTTVITEKQLIIPLSALPANIQFVSCSESKQSAREIITSVLAESSDHVLLCSSTCKPKEYIDINKCIQELEKTFSYAVYLHLHHRQQVEKNCAPISDELIAWQPYITPHCWSNPHKLGMILYRKRDIMSALNKTIGSTMDSCKKGIAAYYPDIRATGLFFKKAMFTFSK